MSTSASEDIGQSLGQLLILIFQSVIPTDRDKAGLIILLLILAVAAAVPSPRLEWWCFVVYLWWVLATSKLWIAALSIATIAGAGLLAWVDFEHFEVRGSWLGFYTFSGIAWLVTLVCVWNEWPYEDTFWQHLTYAFLLYAVVANFYGTSTSYLKLWLRKRSMRSGTRTPKPTRSGAGGGSAGGPTTI